MDDLIGQLTNLELCASLARICLEERNEDRARFYASLAMVEAEKIASELWERMSRHAE